MNLENQTCPICKGLNACAIANTQNLDAPCWCRVYPISPKILDYIPIDKQNKCCVCVECSKKLNGVI